LRSSDIHKLWPVLKKQAEGLDLPWLEEMVQGSRKDPFKVLISCILSLRTQDKTTAEASKRLFNIAPDVSSMSKLTEKKIEKIIYPVGFYKVKSAQIKKICKTLISEYDRKVPDERDELLKLKGVGRKTANLVITLGFDKPGICVDTHVHRITNRWGYMKTKTPDKTEIALRRKLPAEYWAGINGFLVAFGQGICRPISPFCSRCDIEKFCAKAGVTAHR